MSWNLYPIEQFERLAPAWDAVNDAASGPPFLQSRFIRPLCGTFGDPSLKIALFDSAQGPLAMGILTRKSVAQWETFQPSQLPIGAWVMRPDQDFENLLSGLMKKLPGVALIIGVTQQDPNCLRRPMKTSCLHTFDYIKTALIPIAGNFDDYWSKRGKNLRHNMKRQRAKLAQDGVITHLETLVRPEEVESALADYGRLESAGWKAEDGTAVHPDNAQGRFYRAMLETFCRAGSARIYRYRFDERVVAVDLCVEGGGALVILKTTYDESIKTASPAFLMREDAFRRVFEEGRIRRIEFYGKLMDWHTRWSDEVRTMYHVNCYRWPLLHNVHRMLGGAAGEPSAVVVPARATSAPSSIQAAPKWQLVAASEFGKYSQAWHSLSRDMSPVLDPAFIKLMLSVFGSGNEWLAIYGSGQSVAALAVLCKRGMWSWQTFQPSQGPLGPWLHRANLSWEQLLPELLEILPGKPLLLGITQTSALQFPRPLDRGRIRTLDYARTGRIRVNRSFKEYWMARDGSLRRQIERRLRRLWERGIEPRLEAITDPAVVSGAIEEFGRLESSGWKGRTGTAIHIDNAQGAFYSQLMQEFCARGNGVIYRYLFNETTAAMELCIEGGGTLIMLKTAYDEAHKSYAPGILMRLAIFEQVFASRRITTIEFLGKFQSWQTKWTDDVYPLYHINIYRSSWLPKVLNVFGALRRGAMSLASTSDGEQVDQAGR